MWFNHTLDSRSQVLRIIPLPVVLLTTVETLSPTTATYLPIFRRFCNLWDWSNTWTTSVGLLLFFLAFWRRSRRRRIFLNVQDVAPRFDHPLCCLKRAHQFAHRKIHLIHIIVKFKLSEWLRQRVKDHINLGLCINVGTQSLQFI